jgi:hypothetical protein
MLHIWLCSRRKHGTGALALVTALAWPESVNGMLMVPLQALSTSMTIILTLVIFLFVVPIIFKIIHIIRVQVPTRKHKD